MRTGVTVSRVQITRELLQLTQSVFTEFADFIPPELKLVLRYVGLGVGVVHVFLLFESFRADRNPSVRHPRDRKSDPLKLAPHVDSL